MVSHNYWLKRASLQDSLMRATEDETIKRINNQLAILEDDLVKEIHTFYSRYAQDNRMTQADAMKYLTDDELKEFQNVNLARFREMALDPKTDPALLDALSYRHRISRKQAMIHEIQRKTREVYSSSGAISATVGKGFASGYIKTATQVGKDMAEAGIFSIKPVIKLNDDLILRRMSSKWSGKEFSSRVWTQGQEHFNSIRETLDKAFTGGWSLDKTVLELRKRTGVARHNAERLVRTEMTAYNTMANYDMYKALGAKTYKIEAILDSKTSAVCRHQNNKVYLMDDFAPGTTAPPFHVHCRSKIIPTTPEEESKFLESHGYGAPDDSSDELDQDGQSTSARKPTLDEVVQMYVNQARELSEKYGLPTVEQVRKNHRGILDELNQARKKGNFVDITDQAIDKVKFVRVSGMSVEESLNLQLAHKELLQDAMVNNASREVMHILIPGSNPLSVRGGHNMVDPNSNDIARFILNSSKKRSLVVAHNHPGLSGFSLNDLLFFLRTDSVGTLTIVTNQGKVMYMTKSPKFELNEALKKIQTFAKVNQNLEDHVDSIIKSLYNVGVESKVR
nr:MAG TPA: minor capsid protein [Caudoviricetes sp.]